MCGRTVALAARIDRADPRHAIDGGDDLGVRYNVCPAPGLDHQAAPRAIGRFEQYEWGLLPAWRRTQRPPGGPINARAETVAEKAEFRDCYAAPLLVPIDGLL